MNTIAGGSKTNLSTRSQLIVWAPLTVLLILLVLLLGAVAGLVYWASSPAGNLLTDNLSAPLGGATTARVDISTEVGHLTIDKLSSGAQMLASGTLQYFEGQGLPTRSVSSENGQATLTLTGRITKHYWFRSPWPATNGAPVWQIHLNPNVQTDIAAHSGGGNVKLDLAGMAVTRVSADSGAGDMDVVLPDDAANLSVTVKTGAGNVSVDVGSGAVGGAVINANSGAGTVIVRIPAGIAARIHATSGLGNVTMDRRFSKIDDTTYRSPDYDNATNKVDITANTGTGKVSVDTK